MLFIQAAVREQVESEQVGRNPHQELLDYINSPLEIGIEDPVQWWGVSNLYPTQSCVQWLIFVNSTIKLSIQHLRE